MSGTSADALLAIGFASFLGQLNEKQYGHQDEVSVQDAGYGYCIRALPIDTIALSDADLQQLLIVLPLDSSRQREKRASKGETSSVIDGFDYDQKMEDSRTYREQLKKLGPAFQTPEARLRRAPELREFVEPDPRLGNYQSINQMKIAGTFNDLALRWDRLTPEQKRLHIDLLLRLFGNPINNVAGAIKEWQQLAKDYAIKGNAMVSALQIVNPTTGKGANRAKASELTIGNQDSFWLLELLKFRGFMEGTAPLAIQDSDDRKFYVFLPQTIKISLLQGLMKQFRAVLWPTTAVKLDILASLRFTQVFIAHYKEQFEQDPLAEPWMPEEMANLAQGFDVTFYKFLGSAHATMNIATIGLPGWLPKLDGLAHIEGAARIVEEHIQLVRQIRNSKGEEGAEEYHLLHLYRDFLSSDDLHPFWEFTTAYSSYVISAQEKKRFVQLLTTQGLENLIMNNQREGAALKNIVENDGFKRVADAIRQSTITAQYRRTQLGDRTYDTRYGLAQELKRKSHRREEFMEALGYFLQKYSEETAREEEKVAARLHRKLTLEDRRANRLRSNVTENDLASITDLIDQYGSGLICSMLIAFGYARRSQNEEA